MIIGAGQVIGLHIGEQKRDVGKLRLAHFALCNIDKVPGAIDADGRAQCPHLPGYLLRGVAEAAANIKNALARRIGVPFNLVLWSDKPWVKTLRKRQNLSNRTVFQASIGIAFSVLLMVSLFLKAALLHSAARLFQS